MQHLQVVQLLNSSFVPEKQKFYSNKHFYGFTFKKVDTALDVTF